MVCQSHKMCNAVASHCRSRERHTVHAVSCHSRHMSETNRRGGWCRSSTAPCKRGRRWMPDAQRQQEYRTWEGMCRVDKANILEMRQRPAQQHRSECHPPQCSGCAPASGTGHTAQAAFQALACTPSMYPSSQPCDLHGTSLFLAPHESTVLAES
jgi:hypothetical protein